MPTSVTLPGRRGKAGRMKKLMKLAALGAIGVALRKVMAQRGRPEAANVDLREPQKTVEDVEAKVGTPVRP